MSPKPTHDGVERIQRDEHVDEVLDRTASQRSTRPAWIPGSADSATDMRPP
jgi:hypothetical protein